MVNDVSWRHQRLAEQSILIKKIDSIQNTAEFRQHAERELAAKSETATDTLTDEKKLMHELQVHQIELEMQNEALREAHRLAEEARSVAERAQERYTELFDFAPMAYFILGRDGVIHQTNFQGANLLGIKRSRRSRQYFAQSVSNESRPVFNRFLEKIFSTNDTHSCEITLQLGETPCCVAINASADQSRQSCLMAVSDISARKQAERVLNLFKAMVEISLDGLWIVDLMGNLLQANEAYAKISGYSIDELQTMHISQLEAIEGPAQIKTHIAKIVTQGSDLFETRHRHKDGHTIDIEISVIFLPEFQQFCVFCRDVTERKLMEKELKASEVKFRSIIEVSPVPMVLNDEGGNMTFLNPAFVETFGYNLEDIPTLADWWLKAFPDPDYRHWVKAAWRTAQEKAHREKTNFPPLELVIHCKNNRLKTMLATAAPMQPDVLGDYLAILFDITQRKQREEQDKEHLDELAHVTRLELIREMASGIAHEANQPLAAISSYTQASLNLINAKIPDLAKLKEILYKTQQQALSAGQIIHRTRKLVSSHPNQRTSIDINALVHDAVSLCSAEIKQNDIKLTLELENNLPPVFGDPLQIEQVLINLIRNGKDALLNLPEKQPHHLSIHSQLTLNKGIQVRVKDDGPGIDPVQQLKLLMPFYTTKTNIIGMGLAICRSIIEAHKGTFRFNSELGKGTTFYFTLPTGITSNGGYSSQ